MNTLKNIIPIPAVVEETPGTLSVRNLTTYAVIGESSGALAADIQQIAQTLRRDWRSVPENGTLTLLHDNTLAAEEWTMDITASGVSIRGGDRSALRYALQAFVQMLMTAISECENAGHLTCGHLADKPRFAWRGFLLDSARHFQRPETIRGILRLMSAFRLNKFHWHLIDSEGFRMPSSRFPDMAELATNSPGAYTKEDIENIVTLADSYDIEIIPELDAPGHFAGFLAKHPEFACNPSAPGNECCLGNPKTMEMITSIYSDAMELFPNSRFIHVGGDEADSSHWETCPHCQAALHALGANDIRQLEHHFMAQLKDFVRKSGRTPISWSIPANTTQSYPMEFSQDDVIQTWLDLREPIFWAKQGNRVIYSLHTSLYLDYPKNFSETHEPWMFALDDKGIYLCDPYGIWADQVKDAIIGTEACLWTETVPEWRVFTKIFSRLPAYSECCWSRPDRKDWYDFSRRKEILEGAGYFDFLNCRLTSSIVLIKFV